MDTPLTVFSAAEWDDHQTPSWHPEHRGRLDAALAAIDEANLHDATRWQIPELASVEDLALVHDRDYIESIRMLCASGGGDIDADTVASAGSWETARRSAGGVIDAIGALKAGECEVAFAAGRPPGHHAVRAKAMGFCLFNNAAIGAAKLAAEGEKVAIVDWDVHHGNGTQDIFYDDPNVLYISTHESPLYPGTGRLRETGEGAGAGLNMNIPFPAGTAGKAFRAAFDEIVIPAIERFSPDWLFISAGFDAHRDDPLAGLQLTAGDYADLTTRLMTLVAPRRVVVVLEGGYDMGAITAGAGATLSALLGHSYRPEAASSGDVGMGSVSAAKQLWDF